MGLYESLLPLLQISISGIWSQEIQMMIAFTLGKINLAAHVVLQTIANVFIAISFENSFTLVIIVGYYLGKKELEKIKKMLYISSTFASGIVIMFIFILLCCRTM